MHASQREDHNGNNQKDANSEGKHDDVQSSIRWTVRIGKNGLQGVNGGWSDR
jgi:hypothetical protein